MEVILCHTSNSVSHFFLLILSVGWCKLFPLTGITFHPMHSPHSVLPFPYQWTCRLLPILCRFKHCCSEHLCTWLEQKLHNEPKVGMNSTSTTHSLCDFKRQFHHLFKTRWGGGILLTLPYQASRVRLHAWGVQPLPAFLTPEGGLSEPGAKYVPQKHALNEVTVVRITWDTTYEKASEMPSLPIQIWVVVIINSYLNNTSNLCVSPIKWNLLKWQQQQGFHSASLSYPPTFAHIRKYFLKFIPVGLVCDWEIRGGVPSWFLLSLRSWGHSPSKGLPLATLAYKILVMAHAHLTKVLWRLIMACEGLWRWNALVIEVNGLRHKAFLRAFMPSLLLFLPFKSPGWVHRLGWPPHDSCGKPRLSAGFPEQLRAVTPRC